MFLFKSLCVCVCVCARDSLLLYSLPLWVCMRTSRCRRRSLQPHSLQSSFDCRSALCPANPKTSVVLQSHTLTQTYIDIHNSPPPTHTHSNSYWKTPMPLILCICLPFYAVFLFSTDPASLKILILKETTSHSGAKKNSK